MRRVRNHHHVSLRYFCHLRLTRKQDEITPLYGGIASIKKPPNWRLVVLFAPSKSKDMPFFWLAN
ncbi:hypothetical protein U3C50_004223 [Providencia rettgeri]|nr:hypothetical protein [Providencia rettgeri]